MSTDQSKAEPHGPTAFSIDHIDNGVFKFSFLTMDGKQLFAINLPLIELSQVGATISLIVFEYLKRSAEQTSESKSP